MSTNILSILSVSLVIVGFYRLACYLAFDYKASAERPSNPLFAVEPKNSKEGAQKILKILIFMTISLSLLVLIFRFIPSVGEYFFYFITFFALLNLFYFLDKRDIGDTKKATWRILSYIGLSLVITFIWARYRNWLIQDIVNLAVGLLFLVKFRITSLKNCAIISIGIILYDASAVFASGQMIAHAENLSQYPFGMLVVPDGISPSSKPIMFLGVGDIVIPGFIILASYWKYGKTGEIAGILGYLLGGAVTLWVLIGAQFPQPATIYLIPGVWLGLFFASSLRSRKKISPEPEIVQV